ncbi:hypothetical protein LTR10_004392 [Elasticomyces elasticus]|nr:hypothetical protein LTR10_004392 [Elasticomyces elasticus]KAK4976709.1 hypothetical protein LTR42_002754 [Elasticomyces elasticus]
MPARTATINHLPEWNGPPAIPPPVKAGGKMKHGHSAVEGTYTTTNRGRRSDKSASAVDRTAKTSLAGQVSQGSSTMHAVGVVVSQGDRSEPVVTTVIRSHRGDVDQQEANKVTRSHGRLSPESSTAPMSQVQEFSH